MWTLEISASLALVLAGQPALSAERTHRAALIAAMLLELECMLILVAPEFDVHRCARVQRSCVELAN